MLKVRFFAKYGENNQYACDNLTKLKFFDVPESNLLGVTF